MGTGLGLHVIHAPADDESVALGDAQMDMPPADDGQVMLAMDTAWEAWTSAQDVLAPSTEPEAYSAVTLLPRCAAETQCAPGCDSPPGPEDTGATPLCSPTTKRKLARRALKSAPARDPLASAVAEEATRRVRELARPAYFRRLPQPRTAPPRRLATQHAPTAVQPVRRLASASALRPTSVHQLMRRSIEEQKDVWTLTVLEDTYGTTMRSRRLPSLRRGRTAPAHRRSRASGAHGLPPENLAWDVEHGDRVNTERRRLYRDMGIRI